MIIYVYFLDSSVFIFLKVEYFVEIFELIFVGFLIFFVLVVSFLEVIYELREGNKDGVFFMNSYFGFIVI